ncbi:DUF1194 domain-containing protein [Anabaena sp. UHCC 0399]|uniref:DUF1194 domain-containing protein n=1 Tax=Anabaena sp. UHCC 0399 TaxID=3110238 RepID=UPI002B204108|nr:DUF1194 domain-containing protein [Anabaena sp. UHCC 0399]MEA5563955.1 DUF1194 domain-containing protein [Anabaena sp. UHCC 0399]
MKTSFFFQATLTTVAGTLSALAISTSANAATFVDTELSLLVDVSGSVSTSEFNLQKQGYVDAFNNADLFNNFISQGNTGKIAVNLIYWSGATQQQQSVGWTLIDSVEASQNFANAISATTRPFGGSTVIGSAIDFATPLIFNNDFDSTRQVIDVSGDGASNAATTSAARDAALAAGVDAINGLVIGNSTSLFNFYNNNVKGGTGAFVLQANTFQDFAATVQQKLEIEISAPPTTSVPEPATLIGLLGLGAFGVTSKLKRHQKQSVKC